ncbi:hypothetical protein [Antrihabitans sp. YC2-6]|uniref:hypothetical protein n=1 Tax=Antrihabitans sp. YC2-6 TaxID=2799498 RepID=UPI0018F2D82E|nr:hypothetical protein [Antrihabitans sp. YC2-6]MBJ8347748.1 hypothetical protein [Antrihabitans sp. YC2-6]
MTTQPAGHRLLRLVLKCDRAGSAWFIGIALALAPLLVLVEPLRDMDWLIFVPMLGFAIWLALLGVCMALGLTLSAHAGEDLPENWWLTMLDDRR